MLTFAELNLLDVEVALQDMAIYAALGVRPMRGNALSFTKLGFGGFPEDVTDADNLSQLRCREVLERHLPGFGCIAEENGLRIPCGFADADVYVTIDPIDGTTAFKNDYPYGVTVMVSLVVNSKVVAAYIVDVNNCDVFGFGPATSQVKHWRNFGYDSDGEALRVNYSHLLSEQAILLRDERESYMRRIAAIARSTKRGGIFRRYVSSDSGVSIGSSMLQLVRGHVGALVMRGNRRWTPWDDTPLMGLAQASGFVYLRPNRRGTRLEEFAPQPPREIKERPYEIVVVHRMHAAALQEAFAA